jgi:protein-disulfide isomerase
MVFGSRPLMLTRRSFNAAFGSALTTAGFAAVIGVSPFGFIQRALAEDALKPEDLAAPSPLGDMALGSPDATVTIIEYASMTCPHCAHFHDKVYPKLKTEYIDTGKVKFIFREFPLDVKAAAGSMLARCVAKSDPAKYFAVVDILFRTQETWVPNDTVAALQRVGRQAGLSEQTVDTCLKDQKILDAIKKTQEHAYEKLKVNSTPTFFVNGTLLKGGTEIEEFRKVIDPMLKS